MVLCLAACGDRPSEAVSANPANPASDAAAQAPGPPEKPLPGIDLALAAIPPVSGGHTGCKDIWGYLTDPDPAGRIVRDAPLQNGRELGRILPPEKESDYGLAATFQILGSKDGWLEIADAGYDPQLYGKAPPPMYSGHGWIAGGGIHVTLQSSLGFAMPSHKSPVLVDLTSDGHFDATPMLRVVACEGRWVLADWRTGPDKDLPTRPQPKYRQEAVVSKRPLVLRAWVTGVCNIQETTCDGVNGNRSETSRLGGEY
ncbi:hypothetical protein [Novosphingobium sp.]|uniref:hypothetical protein n=1 Tax=Novosphingobium sp. TaxID=1874826 RepID=UPI00286B7685|nr:hypothetical protein [Novosphingobium sp.]